MLPAPVAPAPANHPLAIVRSGAGKLYHTDNPPNHDEPKSWSPETDGKQVISRAAAAAA